MAIIKIKRGASVPTGLTAGELAWDYLNSNLFIGATGTQIIRIAGSNSVQTFNGLSGAVSGVTTSVANTFTPVQTFNGGINASGATFTGDIAVNGGDITTTSATATLFNATATSINIGNTQTGVTLNVASGTAFSGNKNINIGTGNGGGAVTNLVVGGASNDKISLIGSITLGSPALTTTRIVGNALNVSCSSEFLSGISGSGLATFNGGILATGGITFNSPIISTRLPRHSSTIFETKTADFSPAEADNGKIFIVTVTGKGTVTITFDGLSVGWRAKFLCTDSGQVTFTSSLGTVVGTYGFTTADFFAPIIEVICYGTDLYYAG